MAEEVQLHRDQVPVCRDGTDALRGQGARQGRVVKLRDAVAITKTEKGKIKLHQTKDDTIGSGFVKGGVIGILFAMLFGPVGWIAMGAAAGGLFASFDRGIKNRLLKELGQDMTPTNRAGAPRRGGRLAGGGRADEGARLRGHGRHPGHRRRRHRRSRSCSTTRRRSSPRPRSSRFPPSPRLSPSRKRFVGPRRCASPRSRASAPNAAKLAAAGIKTTDDLLNAGRIPGRRELARDHRDR